MDRLVSFIAVVCLMGTISTATGAETKRETPALTPAADTKNKNTAGPIKVKRVQNEQDACFNACDTPHQRCSTGCSEIRDDEKKTGCYSGCDFGYVGCLKQCEDK
jgi:hypothetical protein